MSYYKTAGISVPKAEQDRIVVSYKGRFDHSNYWPSAVQTLEVQDFKLGDEKVLSQQLTQREKANRTSNHFGPPQYEVRNSLTNKKPVMSYQESSEELASPERPSNLRGLILGEQALSPTIPIEASSAPVQRFKTIEVQHYGLPTFHPKP